MTSSAVPARKLRKLDAAELIGQYDLAIAGHGGMPNRAMQRKRVSQIVDLILNCAESGDEVANQWLLNT